MSSKLFFVHIPKSAGTSFRNTLQQNFRCNEIFAFYSFQKHAERIEQLNKLPHKNKIKLLLGHLGYGIHTMIDSHIDYITILRDPVKRVVSMYYHIKRDVNHQFYNEVSKMSLKDYVLSDIDESATNSQTRFLSGAKFYYEMRKLDDTIGFLPFGNNEEMYEAAKNNLTSFSFFGITERFDESLILLKEQTPIENIYYHRFGTAKNKSKEKLSTDVIEAIVSRNELDIRLYDYASRLFSERIGLVDNLQQKLTNFRKLNEKLGPYWGYKTRIKFKLYAKVSDNFEE